MAERRYPPTEPGSTVRKALGYSGSVVSQVLNWKYEGDWRSVIVDLDRWLDDQVKRDNAPKTSEFVWTGVAREMMTVAGAAATLKTIGLVYGPTTSGIGKTMALKAIAAEKAGSILVTIEKVQASTTGLLWAICNALRISTGHTNAFNYQRIKGVLAGTPRLLLVDQIHNLCGAKGDKPLYMLADLWDATGAPQLWCGTSDIVAYLERGQAKGQEPLAQIRRRIGISRDLMERVRSGGPDGKGEPLYSVEEIRRVFAKNKLRLAPDAARYLWQLANLPDSGALGAAKNVVVMATMVNEPTGATVLTAGMLRAAQRLLVNGRALSLMDARMEETYGSIAKVG
jgi:hypothetical protein